MLAKKSLQKVAKGSQIETVRLVFELESRKDGLILSTFSKDLTNLIAADK